MSVFNKKWFFLVIFTAVILFFTSARAADLSYSGDVSNQTVYRVVDRYDPETKEDDEDLMKIESRLKLAVSKSTSTASFFASAKITYDPYDDDTVDDETEVELDEAYMDIYFDKVDVRIGKQVVVWGKSDGMPITDIVTPLDLTEFILPSWEDMRMAIPLVKMDYYLGNFTIEGVFIPKFYPSDMATSGDWTLKPDLDEFERKSDINVGETDETDLGGIRTTEVEPDSNMGNTEYGIKLSGFLFDTDFSILYFRTFEDTPTVEMPPELNLGADLEALFIPPLILSKTFYNQVDVYGFTFSRPVSSFVLRGEAAYYKGKYFAAMDPVEGIEEMIPIDLAALSEEEFNTLFETFTSMDSLGRMHRKNYLHYMLGTDYSGIPNLMLSFQFEQKYIFGYRYSENLRNFVTVQKQVIYFDEDDSLNELLRLTAKLSSPDSRQRKVENSITLVANGRYMQDKLVPEIVYLYNLSSNDYIVKLSLGYNISEGLWGYVGYNILEGDDDTAFGIFDDNDNVYVKLKYSF